MAVEPDHGVNEFVAQIGPFRHGRFRLAVEHPGFAELGSIGSPTVVFPREPVQITQDGSDPVVSDPNIVMCYDRQRPYTRQALGPRGDRCEWFEADPGVIDEIAQAAGVSMCNADEPFGSGMHVLCPSALYQQQRRISHSLVCGMIEGIEAEEWVGELFSRMIAGSRPTPRTSGRRRSTARAHRELTQHAKHVLATRYDEPLTLGMVASQVFASPFHLARVFHVHAGRTVHEYLTRIRLAAALDRLEAGADLTGTALDVGFSSHSHFTQAFGKVYGITPSRWRAARPDKQAKI
ncbi:MAG: AraC family transcriptional regulator [Planctomycetota bacterium]